MTCCNGWKHLPKVQRNLPLRCCLAAFNRWASEVVKVLPTVQNDPIQSCNSARPLRLLGHGIYQCLV